MDIIDPSKVKPVSKVPPKPPPPRLTITESVYHQVPGDNPIHIPAGFSVNLTTDEQPFIRKLKVGESWQGLPECWLTECSQIIIVNELPHFATNPTLEQKQELAAKIVEISFLAKNTDGLWLVPPGQSFRGLPSNLQALRFRCKQGETRCTVAIFPR
jgi:hypothetical protein